MSIASEIKEWAAKYTLSVDHEALDDLYSGSRFEIDSQLFNVLQPAAKYVEFLEVGAPSSEYLAPTINEILAGQGWVVESVSSSDDWQTARVTLSDEKGNQQELYLDDIEDSDWIPPSLFEKLEQFSKTYCGCVVKVFASDDPYLVIDLSFEANNELEEILARYCTNEAGLDWE